jgi:two-component system OmpR family response regulator
MRVLAAEDNPVFQSMLKTMLTKWGYQAVIARSGTEAWRVLQTEDSPRLAVLDWMMPGMDGLEICRRIRSANREPYIYILLLTARTESQDVIEGMDAGADDYLTKPFAARELLARINAVLRRTRMLPPNLLITETGRLLGFGRWRLDTSARHLLDEDGTMVALSGAEYRLLRVFLDHPQRVLSRDQLLNLTQGRDADLFDRSIDLLVSRLRQRLKDDPKESTYIKTVRSEGYVFSYPVELLGAES